MSGIRGKDTKAEVSFRKALTAAGIRGYRKNCPGVSGHPDICFKSLRIAIFLDGEFWHGYDLEATAAELKTNRAFWLSKSATNMARDRKVDSGLASQGYIVLRFWERESQTDTAACIAKVAATVKERRLARAFRPLKVRRSLKVRTFRKDH